MAQILTPFLTGHNVDSGLPAGAVAPHRRGPIIARPEREEGFGERPRSVFGGIHHGEAVAARDAAGGAARRVQGGTARQATARGSWDPVFTADYRYEHTLRVAHYAGLIAQRDEFDRELRVAASLLHDVAYFGRGEENDWGDHGRIGARISRPVLIDAGFFEEEAAVVRHAIAVHVDGRADDEEPSSPIDDVVSDADNVDRFSAYRVVRWCMTERDDLQRMADMIRERLHRHQARNPLKTRAGQELFARQVELQIAFFEAIVHDAEITRLPGE